MVFALVAAVTSPLGVVSLSRPLSKLVLVSVFFTTSKKQSGTAGLCQGSGTSGMKQWQEQGGASSVGSRLAKPESTCLLNLDLFHRSRR